LAGSISVTLGIIVEEFLIIQLSHEGGWVSSPDLSSWNETASPHNCVGKDMASSLEPSSLLNNAILADNNIIIDDAGMDVTVGVDSHILSNIARSGDTML
jgi:hypothetical protein